MSKRVYIAGPYSADSNVGVIKNVVLACEMFEKLREEGYVVYCPHWSHWQDQLFMRSYDDWLEHDLQWLAVCDVMYRLPGESNGSNIEERFAKEHGIPVVRSIEELKKL